MSQNKQEEKKDDSLAFENLYRVPYLMGISQSKSFIEKKKRATQIIQQLYGKANKEQTKQEAKTGRSKLQIDYYQGSKIGQFTFQGHNITKNMFQITKLSSKLVYLRIQGLNNRYWLLGDSFSGDTDCLSKAEIQISKPIILSQGLVIELQKGVVIKVNSALHVQQPDSKQNMIYLNKIHTVQKPQQVELSLVHNKKRYNFNKSVVTYLQNKEQQKKEVKKIPQLSDQSSFQIQFKEKKYWCLSQANIHSKPHVLINQDSKVQIRGGKIKLEYSYYEGKILNEGQIFLEKKSGKNN